MYNKRQRKSKREVIMKKSYLLIVSFIMILLASCQNKVSLIQKTESQIKDSQTGEIVLGEKMENPFSINSLTARAVYTEDLQANYLYFRVRIQDNYEALNFLHDRFGDLEYVPMDREIVEGGFYYIDEELLPEDWPWFYFMTSVEDYNYILQSPYPFEVEVLDSLYIEDEIYESLLNGDTEALEETVLGKSCKEEMEEEESSARFATKKFFWTVYHTAKPSGKITFQDMLNSYKDTPLRNVTVKTWQLPLITTSALTDSDGKFTINNNYSDLIIKNVHLKIVYDNKNCELNGYNMNWDELGFFTGIGAIAQYICPAYYSVGKFPVTEELEKLEIKLKDSSSSTMKRANDLAQIINAVEDYHDFCKEYGITEPVHCNMLFVGGGGSACTLMGSYTTKDELELLGFGLGAWLGAAGGAGLGTLVGTIISSQIPDIIVTTKDLQPYNIESIYHELSHASHFTCVGQSYWQKEHAAMLGYWVSQPWEISTYCYPHNNPLVDYVESWAYLAGYYVQDWKYKCLNVEPEYELSSLLSKDRLVDKNDRDKKHRFYAPGYYDLIDDDSNIRKTDFIESGSFTIKDIFDVYQNRKIMSIDSFIDEFADKHNLSEEDKENVKKTIYGVNYEE